MAALIIGIIMGLVLVTIIVEGSHFFVFGWFLKEKELDAYFGKYFDSIEVNQFSEDATLLTGPMPYFASCSSPSVLSRWYIQKYGPIPRWSKWSKKLDEKRKELAPLKVTPPPLSTL